MRPARFVSPPVPSRHVKDATARGHHEIHEQNLRANWLSLNIAGRIAPRAEESVDAARIAHLRGGSSRANDGRKRGVRRLGVRRVIGGVVRHYAVVEHVLGAVTARRNHAPVRAPEAQRAVRIARDMKAAFVQQAVVMRAQQGEIVDRRLAAVDPMTQMMRGHVVRPVTTGKRAAAIARPERAPQRCRNGALLAACVERRAALVFHDRNGAAVAQKTLNRRQWLIGPARPSADG